MTVSHHQPDAQDGSTRDEANDHAGASQGLFFDDYLLYLLAKASSVASGQFHAQLRARNIAVSTWRILAVLYGSGPVTVGVLASATLLQQPTLTKTLDRLTDEGLVLRSHDDKEDRRRVRVRLTAKGEAMAAELVPLAEAHQDVLARNIGLDDVASLRRVLKAIIALELAPGEPEKPK